MWVLWGIANNSVDKKKSEFADDVREYFRSKIGLFEYLDFGPVSSFVDSVVTVPLIEHIESLRWLIETDSRMCCLGFSHLEQSQCTSQHLKPSVSEYVFL